MLKSKISFFSNILIEYVQIMPQVHILVTQISSMWIAVVSFKPIKYLAAVAKKAKTARENYTQREQ